MIALGLQSSVRATGCFLLDLLARDPPRDWRTWWPHQGGQGSGTGASKAVGQACNPPLARGRVLGCSDSEDQAALIFRHDVKAFLSQVSWCSSALRLGPGGKIHV